MIFGKGHANGKRVEAPVDVKEDLDKEESAKVNNTPTQVEKHVNLGDDDIQSINHSSFVNQTQQATKTINHHVRKRRGFYCK